MLAFGLGAYYGRRWSAIAALAIIVAIAALSVATWSALQRSGLVGWEFTSDNPWPAAIGMSLVLSALALVGPISFKRWERAFALSLVLVLAVVLTQLPMMLVACVLFGACI
jgi:hypothetical protein